MPSSDLPALEAVATMDLASEVGHLVVGCFANEKHCIVVKCGREGLGFDWHVPLSYMHGSCIIAWPAQVLQVPGHPRAQYIKLLEDIPKPALLPVFDWGSIVGYQYTWRAWGWQRQHLQSAMQEWRPALRMIIEGAEAPLSTLAAKAGWWGLDSAQLHALAKNLKINVAEEQSLLNTLTAMTKSVLRVGDGEALSCMSRRLVDLECAQDCVPELLEIDEASKCLQFEDEKQLVSEQRARREKLVTRETFIAEYTEKKRAAGASRGSSSSGAAAGKRKAKPSAKLSLGQDIAGMPQREAKKFLPPDAFLWQNRTDQAWCARLPPVSRSVARHGPDMALRLVLSHVWRQHCTKQGIPLSDAGVAGLIANPT